MDLEFLNITSAPLLKIKSRENRTLLSALLLLIMYWWGGGYCLMAFSLITKRDRTRAPLPAYISSSHKHLYFKPSAPTVYKINARCLRLRLILFIFALSLLGISGRLSLNNISPTISSIRIAHHWSVWRYRWNGILWAKIIKVPIKLPARYHHLYPSDERCSD